MKTALLGRRHHHRSPLTRPAVVLALGVLIANDHLLKEQFPGWITGKLSDAAGLYLLGALLAWLFPRKLPVALLAAGVAFAFWKSELSTPLILAWNQLHLLPVARVADLSDLLTLPFLVLGGWPARGAESRGGSMAWDLRTRRADPFVALVSLLAFTATSMIYDFELEKYGGPRTVVFAGSASELGTMLQACPFDGYPDGSDGTLGVSIDAMGIDLHLRGELREEEERTVVIFDQGWSGRDPDEDPGMIDRGIEAIETCLNPPEIELPAAETRDASPLLGDLEGTFVVLSRGQTIVHHPARAETRFPPASTFKIPNMLIALATRVASGPDFLIPWDGKRPDDGQFWAESWSRDHTLRSAIENGVLWYYQEIARRVGRELMAAFVRRFQYGNRDISGQIDRFWLDGPLAISAREQVEFLRRFLEGELLLDYLTVARGRDILTLETSDAYSLAGKTGSVYLPSGRLLAWFVGWAERDGETHVFALNLDCDDFESCNLGMRRQLAVAILKDWGILLPSESSQVSPVR